MSVPQKQLPFMTLGPNERTPPEGVIQYSKYELDPASPLAGGCAWVEGDFVPLHEARLSLLDAGFTRSDATYTAAMAWHGSVFRLNDHLDRLLAGAHRMRLESPISKDEIGEISKECVSKSQLRECFLAITLTRGSGALRPDSDGGPPAAQLHVVARPYRWIFPPDQQIHGASVVVAREARRPGRNIADPTIKNYQWADLTRATYEAQDRGADSAILLDSDGWVAEGPGFNVLVVKDGAIATPSRNALPGITRRTAMEIAASMGMRATLRDVALDELYQADEIFGATTAGGITPLIRLDGQPVGCGSPGPITTRIRDRFWNMMDEPSPLIESIAY